MNEKMNKVNQLSVYSHPQFGDIRTMTGAQGEPLFVGKDVALALGYSNTQKAIRDHVDDEDKGVNESFTPGGKQFLVFINESGVYSLILSSKLPQAKAFKRWVTSEVLPQIRKTGGYIPTRNPRTGEALTEGEMVEAANRIMARTIARTNLPADDCMTASDIARSLDMEVRDLNRFLVDRGVQYWNGSRYRLAARYADCGYAEERLFHYFALNGEKKQRAYMVWTPQGKSFILSLF